MTPPDLAAVERENEALRARALERLSTQLGVAVINAMLMRDVTFARLAEHVGRPEPEVRRWVMRMIAGRPMRRALDQAAWIFHALHCEVDFYVTPKDPTP